MECAPKFERKGNREEETRNKYEVNSIILQLEVNKLFSIQFKYSVSFSP
jgi:hypothetical protein